MKQGSDFAKACGIPAVQSHAGFIPENPNEPVYQETVAAMREVVEYCRRNGQQFRYETGQETPITLVRAMQDVGLDNQGVNFDLANLILYGKANPEGVCHAMLTHSTGGRSWARRLPPRRPCLSSLNWCMARAPIRPSASACSAAGVAARKTRRIWWTPAALAS